VWRPFHGPVKSPAFHDAFVVAPLKLDHGPDHRAHRVLAFHDAFVVAPLKLAVLTMVWGSFCGLPRRLRRGPIEAVDVAVIACEALPAFHDAFVVAPLKPDPLNNQVGDVAAPSTTPSSWPH